MPEYVAAPIAPKKLDFYGAPAHRGANQDDFEYERIMRAAGHHKARENNLSFE